MSDPIEQVHGWIHVPVDADPDPEPYRSWLRERGVLASVGNSDQLPHRMLDIGLVTRDGRPVMLRAGNLSSPVGTRDLFTTMTSTLGGLVELDDWDEMIGDLDARVPLESEEMAAWTPPTTSAPASGEVLMARMSPETLDQVLRVGTTVSDVALHEHGEWTVARFDPKGVEPSSGWPAEELPAVWLQGTDQRHIVVVVDNAGEETDDVFLGRWRAPEPVLDMDLVTDEARILLEHLQNPHLGPHGGLADLVAMPFFADVDPVALSAELQSDMDDFWSSRVLKAMGLPTIAADIHEGRMVTDENGPAVVLEELEDVTTPVAEDASAGLVAVETDPVEETAPATEPKHAAEAVNDSGAEPAADAESDSEPGADAADAEPDAEPDSEPAAHEPRHAQAPRRRAPQTAGDHNRELAQSVVEAVTEPTAQGPRTPVNTPASVIDDLRKLEERAVTDPVARGLLGRLYGTSLKRPWGTIVPELLLGLGLVVLFVVTGEKVWWTWAALVFGVLCLADAALDTFLTRKRGQRRKK